MTKVLSPPVDVSLEWQLGKQKALPKQLKASMEIDFNPSQLPASRATGPVNGTQVRPAAASETPALQGMAELQSKLNQISLTRSDKLTAAQPLVSDVQYPPEELLNGIAHLLAIHLGK